ncbi:2OG-Fe(II) oxygenase family protein [bacterium]|nr:2OG-Fe(II) oxygenase family protein [bacterium]
MNVDLVKNVFLQNAMEQGEIYEGFCLKKNLSEELSSIFWREQKNIMNLPSYGFDKFPNGPANRLDKYNIFKLPDAAIHEIKKTLVELIFNNTETQISCWITGWYNLLESGDRLGWHSHEEDRQAFISGLIFLSSGKANLLFLNAEKEVKSVKDIKGHLCLFGTSMDHATDASQGQRLSLAFDIQVGEQKSALWCPLRAN